MSRIDPKQGLMPSLLDRLIDPDAGGTNWRRGYSVEQMFQAVQRDLTDLLNTRQSHQNLPAACTEVAHSIAAYGLPDLTSLNALTEQQREQVGRVLEATITEFEPRLRDVRAVLVNGSESWERRLRFHIEAKLRLEPAPDVAFDTILELATGHYTIQTSS
jgi:type VI secretion system protein ImpF